MEEESNQDIKRFNQLEDVALNKFADANNFIVQEWLDDDDCKEYEALKEKLGF
jgi:hypothetical protein